MLLHTRSGSRCRYAVIAAIVLAAIASGSAHAGLIINLGGGWQAEIIASPTAFADVVSDFVDFENDRIFIQKFWEFTLTNELSGQPEPAHILFRQIAPDSQTVSRIIINNEIIVNNSGVDWNSYQNVLAGNAARFNTALSAGFDVSPFTSLTFSNNNQTATASNGTVPNGAIWTPGLVSGALVIDVDLSGSQPVMFMLKELPGSIPTPGVIACLAIAGLRHSRRRKS